MFDRSVTPSKQAVSSHNHSFLLASGKIPSNFPQRKDAFRPIYDTEDPELCPLNDDQSVQQLMVTIEPMDLIRINILKKSDKDLQWFSVRCEYCLRYCRQGRLLQERIGINEVHLVNLKFTVEQCLQRMRLLIAVKETIVTLAIACNSFITGETTYEN